MYSVAVADGCQTSGEREASTEWERRVAGGREVAGEGRRGEGGMERTRGWRENYISQVNNVVVLYRAFANALTFENIFLLWNQAGRAKSKNLESQQNRYFFSYFTPTDELTCENCYCNTLQHTAIHCNTLQHTATHCNTLQHM